MAKYNSEPKIRVIKRSNKFYSLQKINTLLLISILVYLIKEYWLPLVLSMIK